VLPSMVHTVPSYHCQVYFSLSILLQKRPSKARQIVLLNVVPVEMGQLGGGKFDFIER